LGEVKNGEMILNEYGQLVEYTWNDLPNHNPNIRLGAFCVMPNHVHGIIEIIKILVRADSKSAQMDIDSGINNRADLESAPTNTTNAMDIEMNDDAIVRAGSKPALANNPLSEIIRQFKTFSARRINARRATPGIAVWQRNYYEHIIRHHQSFENISNYIETNPARWNNDKFYNP
jgi:REP element-mobilizing transposase RayT